MQSNIPSYILITPARNEANFIEGTIRSVCAQTLRPLKWIIVSDGSTDGTDEIVKRFLADHQWIELVRMPEHRDRHFGAKVHCFNAGYEKLHGSSYDVIGNLDADITFDETYFVYLMNKFAEDPALGVAGTPFIEGNESYDYRFTNVEHVSGACQLFRRRCFEEVGGYKPIQGGGIDWVAVTTARMKGWKTRTFTEKVCHHHRPMGTASSGKLQAWYKLGWQDYYLGGHPFWEIFRACLQMKNKPYILGGLLLFMGFAWGFVTRTARPVTADLIAFHQKEQLRRLREAISKLPVKIAQMCRN
ncbi:MAG: glycosyltransferase family 2 protein [Nitrospira sp.]|nr:glycosyltransferase family 2 protein [Nitrospira sp.]